jgi:Ca2+-binding EF-hand superfamily protein
MEVVMRNGLSRESHAELLVAALLLSGIAYSSDTPNLGSGVAQTGVSVAFEKVDSNQDGQISESELIAVGLDDLAFRAMDINSDGSVSEEEYAKRQATEAEDEPSSEPRIRLQ